MTDVDELVVERYDSAATLKLRDDILPVYAASHADQMHDPWFHPDQFWERLVELYLPGRDFELVAGRIAGVVVGYAFGSPRDQHGAIWDDLRSTYPAWGLSAEPLSMSVVGLGAARGEAAVPRLTGVRSVDTEAGGRVGRVAKGFDRATVGVLDGRAVLVDADDRRDGLRGPVDSAATPLSCGGAAVMAISLRRLLARAAICDVRTRTDGYVVRAEGLSRARST